MLNILDFFDPLGKKIGVDIAKRLMITLGIFANPSARYIPLPRIPTTAILIRSFAPITRLAATVDFDVWAQETSDPAAKTPAAVWAVLFRNSRRVIRLMSNAILLLL